jgi:tetratricopeptide (TPR) repeat protein
MSDYATELARIDADIATAEAGGRRDVVTVTAVASKRYQRACLTGDLAALRDVEPAIDAGLAEYGPWPDLCVVKASVAATLHRIADARAALALAPGVAGVMPGRAMLADLDREEGRYAAALHAYEAALEAEPAWDAFARLADLKFKLGDAEAADALFALAVDELTAKQMRSYAWVELQWGRTHLRRGRLADAGEHYARARAACAGYWLVDQHAAELLAARGEPAAAAALYEQVAERVPRPDAAQAVGDAYVALGDPERAGAWHDQALAGYLDSARRGEVHYLHHLVGFYADVRPDGDAAVRWAERDLALRPNAYTRAALAWALVRADRIPEAVTAITAALASGVRDPGLYHRAAAVQRAAGHAAQAERLEERAVMAPAAH